MKNYYNMVSAFITKNLMTAVLVVMSVVMGIMMLFGITLYNAANSAVPSVSMTSDNTNFRGNGFLGGVAVRAQYAWQSEKVMQFDTTLLGQRKYFYTVGEHRFNYNEDTKEWVQVK